MLESFRGSRGAAPLDRRKLPATRRLVSLAAVLLAIGALLIAYAVIVRNSPTPTAAPPSDGTVLLDESFDDGRLDTEVFNTCHWWGEGNGCNIESSEELSWYVPEQVSVADGALRLTADRRPVRGSDGKPYDYSSGMITTGSDVDDYRGPAKLAFTYGTVEARLRVPAGQGFWPAFWLLPATRESRPEIDVLEVLGQDPSELIMHLHPEDREAESPSRRYKVRGPDLSEDWHTLRLDWAPQRLEVFLDGTRVWRHTGSDVPDEPMYLVINLAVGGVYPGPPDQTTVFPATFAVDHLRITAA